MAAIRVTAGEGRETPLHSSIASAPGAGLLILKPGDEIDVEESNYLVQRALRSGDLVVVVKKPEPAPKAAPKAKEG